MIALKQYLGQASAPEALSNNLCTIAWKQHKNKQFKFLCHQKDEFMKKLKGTPYNELKIQSSNIWLDLLSSLPLIVVGLWLVFSAQNTTLSCQQIESKQGNCQLTESSLSGSKTQEISLDNLLGGKVTTGRKGSSRVVLCNQIGRNSVYELRHSLGG